MKINLLFMEVLHEHKWADTQFSFKRYSAEMQMCLKWHVTDDSSL